MREPFVAELRQQGYRARAAWRYVNNFTQENVCDQFNDLSNSDTMKPSRISEYETWPGGPQGDGNRPKGVRPTAEVLKKLATIYGTSWDQLVDLADLAHMTAGEHREYREAVLLRSADPGAVLVGDLPPEVPAFTGRDDARSELHKRVSAHIERDGVAVHVIDGPPGVGKTALARYAVSAFYKHYPDGTIWADLLGYTPGRDPAEPTDLLEWLLLQIKVPPTAIAADAGRRARQWRQAMSARRMLLVFDNAADSAQVKDLLPQARGCFVLITSRKRLTGLSGSGPVHPYHLDGMPLGEAEQLLVKLANLRDGYDRAAVRQISETSGGLPLALKLIAGQIAHHGTNMLADSAADFASLAAEIRRTPVGSEGNESAAEHILERFSAEDESVGAAFELSYQRLREPVLQHAVRLLGWFPGTEVTAQTFAWLADVSEASAKLLILKLCEAGFLDPRPDDIRPDPGGPRYRMHDMLRLGAQLHAERDGSPAERATVIDRVIRHSLAIARSVNAIRPFHTVGVQPTPNPPEAAAQARTWLTKEQELLLGSLEITRPTSEAAELARLMAAHLCGLGFWEGAERLYGRALVMARLIEDRPGQAWALLGQGRMSRMRGAHVQADQAFLDVRDIADELGDMRCLAEVQCERGHSAWITGEHADARHHFNEALRIACEIGYRPTQCDALDGLSRTGRMACDYRAAERWSQEALSIAIELADPERVGTVQWGYAEAVRLHGDHDAARQHYVYALHIARSIDHVKLEGDALRGLGHLERLDGNTDTAQQHLTSALDKARRIQDQYGEGWALWGLGNLARRAGNLQLARNNFEYALQLAREIKDPLGKVDALRGLGHIERQLSARDPARFELAAGYYRDSLEVAQEIGDRRGRADALRGLGRLATDHGRIDEARGYLKTAQELYERIGIPLAEEVRGLLSELD
ncbi:tetratricopeptide (TPR) repeat protein [Nocardia transvalensis]|uniref:Tetratricopeptide (TPR) repeat protein n=1 Tax=Nocardia transvalensis TaxID=37333 RepID=A0A7W9UIJ2_9NOCA|nr:tetratricopeptide repeat protein [Nocardia transvalensis]MBB5914326.1 tetratricopeptide (TPR) repeat protein [Nocardia transvalensis]